MEKRKKTNPELKVGDEVILLHMQDESKTIGTKGVVTHISNFYNEIIYGVDWEDGSKLSLLSSCDAWMKPKPKNKIEESDRNKFWSENVDIFKNFNTKVIVKFLLALRESGITNMFGASPFLYMGKEKIKDIYKYEVSDEEKFEEVLELADEVQSAMINGCIKTLESQNKEASLESINSYLRKYSQKLLVHYMYLFS